MSSEENRNDEATAELTRFRSLSQTNAEAIQATGDEQLGVEERQNSSEEEESCKDSTWRPDPKEITACPLQSRSPYELRGTGEYRRGVTPNSGGKSR